MSGKAMLMSNHILVGWMPVRPCPTQPKAQAAWEIRPSRPHPRPVGQQSHHTTPHHPYSSTSHSGRSNVPLSFYAIRFIESTHPNAKSTPGITKAIICTGQGKKKGKEKKGIITRNYSNSNNNNNKRFGVVSIGEREQRNLSILSNRYPSLRTSEGGGWEMGWRRDRLILSHPSSPPCPYQMIKSGGPLVCSLHP
jgi:hypothetical protein